MCGKRLSESYERDRCLLREWTVRRKVLTARWCRGCPTRWTRRLPIVRTQAERKHSGGSAAPNIRTLFGTSWQWTSTPRSCCQRKMLVTALTMQGPVTSLRCCWNATFWQRRKSVESQLERSAALQEAKPSEFVRTSLKRNMLKSCQSGLAVGY